MTETELHMAPFRRTALVAAVLLAAACVPAVQAARDLHAEPLDARLMSPLSAAEFERRTGFDLERTSITFAAPHSAPCIVDNDVERFPVDPRGGQVLAFETTYYAEEIRFSGGFTFPWLGVDYANAFISRQGFITFDKTSDHARTGNLDRHWQDARVSALFADLQLTAASVISWRQLDDAVVITWQSVGESDFQAVLRADGSITFTYLRVEYDGHKVCCPENVYPTCSPISTNAPPTSRVL